MQDTPKITTIILAAGKGTRMQSALPKVLHHLHGRPLLHYSIELAKQLKADPIIVVVGYGAESVRAAFCQEKNLSFALQEPQLGTGHAVMCAMPNIHELSGPVLILNGDVPALQLATLRTMLQTHLIQENSLTVLAMDLAEPGAYGRMVVKGNKLERIVEFRDANAQERAITLVNAGIYIAQAGALAANLPRLTTENDQKEYYLTDLVQIMNQHGLRVGYALCKDPLQVAGVNSQEELRQLEQLLEKAK